MGYYGAKQGITACKDWYDDYIECSTGAKQSLRMRAMFKKRHIDNHLEYLQGKIFKMIVDVSLFEHGSHPQGLLGSGGALDVIVVPILAGGDALLGSVVLDTLQSLQLKV